MNSPSLQRFLPDRPPFQDRQSPVPWDGRGSWKASWVRCPDTGPAPFVTAYRLRFRLDTDTTLKCHVTADERYELFLDGVRIGRGSERGDVLHWFFESYTGVLGAGEHTLVARVWTLGPKAPMAQISTQPGFLFAAEPTELSAVFDTGCAPWEACILEGYTFQSPLAAWGTGANLVLDGEKFPWNFETGAGGNWHPAEKGRPATDEIFNNVPVTDPVLCPSQLPPMLDAVIREGNIRHVAPVPTGQVSGIAIRNSEHLLSEASDWQQLLTNGKPFIVPARTRRRVLLDLGNYFCAYHQITLTGGKGARVEIHWQESLYETTEAKTKGDRNAIEGKYYTTTWHLLDGIGDSFQTDGGTRRTFESLWWHCGRYVQLLVETGAQPVTIEQIQLRETRYPMELEAKFSASDPSLERVIPLAWRTLQMCAHETYLDCPYFEQLQYGGDARLEALVTFVANADRRLPRKAVLAFDWSRLGYGLTQSRYPSGIRQTIPGFSLFWIGMTHDYFFWSGDADLVRQRMPGIREVLARWLQQVQADGAIRGMEGWNYLDWLPEWRGGIPPDGNDGGGASFNFMLQLALRQAAELEKHLGEPEIVALFERRANELRSATTKLYWNESRGLFADDRAQTSYSEHAQSLAILSRAVTGTGLDRVSRGLLTGENLSRTTIYFTHYLFEAYREIGGVEQLVHRLELWRQLGERGLKTTIEAPEPSRSDCHAWASHPLYHYFATILGIRPASPGFQTVEIVPQLGSLEWATGTLPHPLGEIAVEVRREGASLRAVISLPVGLEGVFKHASQVTMLRPGRQVISVPLRVQVDSRRDAVV
jgi:alpha-L-rhamnosidase